MTCPSAPSTPTVDISLTTDEALSTIALLVFLLSRSTNLDEGQHLDTARHGFSTLLKLARESLPMSGEAWAESHFTLEQWQAFGGKS